MVEHRSDPMDEIFRAIGATALAFAEAEAMVVGYCNLFVMQLKLPEAHRRLPRKSGIPQGGDPTYHLKYVTGALDEVISLLSGRLSESHRTALAEIQQDFQSHIPGTMAADRNRVVHSFVADRSPKDESLWFEDARDETHTRIFSVEELLALSHTVRERAFVIVNLAYGVLSGYGFSHPCGPMFFGSMIRDRVESPNMLVHEKNEQQRREKTDP